VTEIDSRHGRDWEKLAGELEKQQQFMEMLTRSLSGDYRSRGGEIYCARGCSGCCNLVVNCTLTEAVKVAAVLNREQLSRVDAYVERLQGLMTGVTGLKEYLRIHRQSSGGCPLLEGDGSCGVYAVRPLSCRALLSTMDSRWCGVDFAALTAAEKEAFMESLDREAVAFPLHYLAASRDAGMGLEQQASRRMGELLGFSLYGNMPVLVHLITRHELGRVALRGRHAVTELLAVTALDNQLLLQVEEE
jgi:Fe-S-cluster containining protein